MAAVSSRYNFKVCKGKLEKSNLRVHCSICTALMAKIIPRGITKQVLVREN